MSLSLDVLRERSKVSLELYQDYLHGIKELQERLQEQKGKGQELYNDPWLIDTGIWLETFLSAVLVIYNRVDVQALESRFMDCHH
jgi:hypothetical protein